MLTMKNVLICRNCGTENPFFSLNCKKCNSYLRVRISNIDLWQTAWQIFESPVKAGEKIIQSDHKNFVVTLLIFVCLKYALLSSMIYNSIYGQVGSIGVFPQAFLSGGLPVIISLLIISIILTALNNLLGIKNRVVDNLSLYTYSFTPQILGLIFLTPIQFALFGKYFFSFNPSPFLIKPMATYVLLVIEILLFVWSIFIVCAFTFAQTKNKLYSVTVGTVISIILLAVIYYMPEKLLVLVR